MANHVKTLGQNRSDRALVSKFVELCLVLPSFAVIMFTDFFECMLAEFLLSQVIGEFCQVDELTLHFGFAP